MYILPAKYDRNEWRFLEFHEVLNLQNKTIGL